MRVGLNASLVDDVVVGVHQPVPLSALGARDFDGGIVAVARRNPSTCTAIHFSCASESAQRIVGVNAPRSSTRIRIPHRPQRCVRHLPFYAMRQGKQTLTSRISRSHIDQQRRLPAPRFHSTSRRLTRKGLHHHLACHKIGTGRPRSRHRYHDDQTIHRRRSSQPRECNRGKRTCASGYGNWEQPSDKRADSTTKYTFYTYIFSTSKPIASTPSSETARYTPAVWHPGLNSCNICSHESRPH